MGNSGGGVAVETVDVTGPARDIGRFSRTAPQNLVLFTFITALTSSVVLIKARRNGVLRRALACRSGLGTQLAGLGLGWFSICLVQGLVIVGVGGLFFGVHWGDPLGAAGLLIVFSLVGCGAGLLVGALGSNEDRVSAITPIVGIVSGALGGCMVPLEVFPEGMRTVARFTPHFWALRGWERLVLKRADAGDVAGSVAVLGAYAVALLVLSTVALRSALLRGS